MSRREIIDVLHRWQAGALTAKQVHDWVQSLYFPGALDYDDEEEGENFVASDVMHALDSIDMNLIVVEDVPIHMEFLATPRGRYEDGERKWQEVLDRIYTPERMRERRRRLANDPFYASFCREPPESAT
jgi:hypothetical protein